MYIHAVMPEFEHKTSIILLFNITTLLTGKPFLARVIFPYLVIVLIK